MKSRKKRPSGGESAEPTPPATPRSNVLRALTNVANRTFHMSLARPQESPTSIHDLEGASGSLEEGQHFANPPGPEAHFNMSAGSGIPANVGAWTSAGWHLVADTTTGSGQPIRARKPNQDSFGVRAPVLGSGLYLSVFDGHGMNGREASQLTRDTVPHEVTAALQAAAERGTRFGMMERRRAFARAFTRAFTEAERTLRDEKHGVDHAFSGTTATCVWLDGAELLCAWVGDSRAVLGQRDTGSGGAPGGTIRAVNITADHKPARRDEKKRVRAAGGRVTRWQQGVGPQRVWLPDEWLPGLAMTRSVGDTVLSRYGVVPQPEVTATALGSREEFVVVASDGVWEFMSSEDVVNFVAREKARGITACDVARKLVDEAVRRWQEYEQVVDDTTAIVAYLNVSRDRRASVFAQHLEDSRTRSLSLRFRRIRSEHRLDKHVGQPWLVAGNGRLEAFASACASAGSADGDGADDDGGVAVDDDDDDLDDDVDDDMDDTLDETIDGDERHADTDAHTGAHAGAVHTSDNNPADKVQPKD